jgi:hypothetical protein
MPINTFKDLSTFKELDNGIFDEEQVKDLFYFYDGGYGLNTYSFTQALFLFGHKLKEFEHNNIEISYKNEYTEGRVLLTEGKWTFSQWFVKQKLEELYDFNFIYAYNQDKDETYIIHGNGLSKENGDYFFEVEDGEY